MSGTGRQPCSVSNCGRPSRALGYCSAHYQRQLRHGDPTAGRIERGECAAWLEAHRGHSSPGCLEWPYARNSVGYGKVQVPGKSRQAHRFMCELAYGPAPTSRHEAAHSCGNRGCVNPMHLRWATASENQMDRVAHGTSNRGAQHGMAKLSEDQARQIKRLAAAQPHQEIADGFGVSRKTVRDIATGRRWAWLEGSAC